MIVCLIRARTKWASGDARHLRAPGDLSLAELHEVLRLVAGVPRKRTGSFSVGRQWYGPPDPELYVRAPGTVTLGFLAGQGFPRFTMHHRPNWNSEVGRDEEILFEDVTEVPAGSEEARLVCANASASASAALRDFEEARRGPTDRKPGRNERCPCGSGKKYKSCCRERDEDRRDLEASPSNGAEPLSALVVERVRSHWSAYRTGPVTPPVVGAQTPELLMHEGYRLADRGHHGDACDLWWELWTALRERIDPDDAERPGRWDHEELLSGECSLRTWTRDFLESAALAAPRSTKHAELGLAYGRELLARFPREDYGFQTLVMRRILELLRVTGREDELRDVGCDLIALGAARFAKVPEESWPRVRPAFQKLIRTFLSTVEGDAWFRSRLRQVTEDVPDPTKLDHKELENLTHKMFELFPDGLNEAADGLGDALEREERLGSDLEKLRRDLERGL
jgi:hypothetical protein